MSARLTHWWRIPLVGWVPRPSGRKWAARIGAGFVGSALVLAIWVTSPTPPTPPPVPVPPAVGWHCWNEWNPTQNGFEGICQPPRN